MKNNIKVISAGLAGILIGGITVVGANEAVRALQNTEIKVSLNGQVQEFKDETTGERQYPLTYNNRTYLPLRNVANLAGLSVDYDNSTNTAVLVSNNSIVLPNRELCAFNNYLLSFLRSYDNDGIESKLVIDGEDDGGNDVEKKYDVAYKDGHFMYKIDGNKLLLTKYIPDGTEINGFTILYRVDYELEFLSDGSIVESVSKIDLNDIARTAAVGISSNIIDYAKKLFEANNDKIVKETFEDAYLNGTVQIGKEYIFTNGTKTHIDFDILNSEVGLESGEKIRIISSKNEEYTEGDSDVLVVITDYEVQRENGEIVTIGQKAGRT